MIPLIYLKKSGRARRRPFYLALLLALLGWLSLPASAPAHPLDEFYQVTYATLAPNRINLNVELYPGILMVPQLLPLLDSNQDQQLSQSEQQAYLARFIKDVTFEIDGQPLPLQVDSATFPSLLELQAGNSVIRFELSARLPADYRGRHQLFYQNNHLPEQGIYLVNALSDDPRWVQITQQKKDVLQRSLRLNYTIDPAAPVAEDPQTVLAEVKLPASRASAGQEQLTSYLYESKISPLFLVVALGLATLLGGLHALTPGHGKTLVAAYLIGSRGTMGHAVALGGIVTLTHTASVILIGLLALLASQFIVPTILVPVLEISSGLLVVYLGLQLVWSRWQALRPGQHDSHGHTHDHAHEHHHHSLPEQVRLSDLLTLGISGGLVPCPEALSIIVIAIGLNRILMGLGLVVAFSFGLAAVLITIGILLVRSKTLLEGLGRVGERWQHWLPLASAVVVTLLGMGIMVKGLGPYLAG